MNKNLFKPAIVITFIFFAISIQSCKIYDTDSVPELEAVESAKKVKVITVDGNTYKFEKLVIDEEQLVGLSKPQSQAAKALPSEKFVDSDGHSKVKVSIDRETIKEINVYDKKKSKKRTIWLAVSLTVGLVLLASASVAVVAVASY